MNDNLTATIEHLKRQIEDLASAIQSDPRMVEIVKYHKALNTLEDLCNQPKTHLAGFLAPNDKATEPQEIGVDTFFGMKPIIAAKKFLKMKGKAASLTEIVDALKSGGCPVSDTDKLRVSLGRSTSQIAKIDDEHYGLVSFYPDLKRSRRKRDEGEGGEVLEENSELDEDETENSEAVSKSTENDSLTAK